MAISVFAGCLSPQANAQITVRLIHSFSGPDGAQPFCPVMQGADGAIYGTAQNRGAFGYGNVFKLNPDGSGFQVLHDINAVTDGSNPSDPVVQGADGSYYVTTQCCPPSLFKFNADGSAFAVIHKFTTNDPAQDPTLTAGRDGFLYGAAMTGGTNRAGVVVKISADGSNVIALYHFNTDSGAPSYPYNWLIQGSDGALYGTSGSGISNAGTIFKINTNGLDFAVLHFFGSSGDGSGPQSKLLQASDAYLYGMTYGGGSNNAGSVFKLRTDGSDYRIIYNFAPSSQGYNPGSAGLAQGADGFLYGVTSHGGPANLGILFRVSTDGTSFIKLGNLGYGLGEIGWPCFGITAGRDGSIYGTGLYGGLYGNGSVFQVLITPLKFTSCERLPDNGFQATLTGASNAVLRIDASTNLANWTTLTNVLNQTGTLLFEDKSASDFPVRFYRAAWMP